MEPRISVVINTLNEEHNLPFALRSVVTWADEVVVVDMHSDDRTVEIARGFGARVFLHERTLAVDGARAFALAQATGDWILVLDADELVPAPLAAALRQIARDDDADLVQFSMEQHLMGAALMHTGWGPTQHSYGRFFRRGTVQARDVIHAYFQHDPAARIRTVPYRPGLAVVHFNHLDVAHVLDKLNRYTTVEAVQRHGRERLVGPAEAALRAGWELVRRMVKHGGWRDGWRGFYLSFFMAGYRLAIYAKMEELERTGGREAIREKYRQEAERLLAEYPADPGAARQVEGPVAGTAGAGR